MSSRDYKQLKTTEGIACLLHLSFGIQEIYKKGKRQEWGFPGDAQTFPMFERGGRLISRGGKDFQGKYSREKKHLVQCCVLARGGMKRLVGSRHLMGEGRTGLPESGVQHGWSGNVKLWIHLQDHIGVSLYAFPSDVGWSKVYIGDNYVNVI